MKLDMTDWHVAVYTSHQRDLLTTGILIPRGMGQAAETLYVEEQFSKDIRTWENEPDDELLYFIRNVDRWDVCVKGRFTPIGQVRVLALLTPPV